MKELRSSSTSTRKNKNWFPLSTGAVQLHLSADSTMGRKKGGGKGRGRQFIQSADEISQRDDKEASWKAEREQRRKKAAKERGDAESSEEEVEGEEEEEDVGALGEEIAALGIDGEYGGASSDGLSRREREEIAKTSSDRAYAAAHAAGQTEEAQSDMARLAAIRERRAVDKKRRLERESKEARLAAERASTGEGDGAGAKKKKKKKKEVDEESWVYLEPIAIKKMKPAKIKEILKDAGQSYQGNKKDLIARLLAFNADYAK